MYTVIGRLRGEAWERSIADRSLGIVPAGSNRFLLLLAPVSAFGIDEGERTAFSFRVRSSGPRIQNPSEVDMLFL